MTRTTKIIILLFATILAIAAIILLLFFGNGEDESPPPLQNTPEQETTSADVDTNAPSSPNNIENIPMVQPETPLRSNLTKTAAAFVERFGSFSNQESNYQNIRDSQIFMTESMKEWSENYIIQSQREVEDNDIYFGVTTKSLSSKILELNENAGRAEILVKTQRIESSGNTDNQEIYYQDMRIEMINIDDDNWKIDSAYWLDKRE